MKIIAKTQLLALLFASGYLHAQTTIPAGATPVTVEGNVEIRIPDAPAVSNGTAPAPSDPILNVGPGATNPGIPSLIHTYSTNGAGTQTQTATTNGGILAEANGNLTLRQTETSLQTATYTIETRELKVSDPAGFTDTTGAYGPIGTFYPNGTTLPGTAVNVATVRDADGNLISVISDIPGVGPVTNVDGSGFPILTPAQIATAVASGSAPAGFFTTADPVVADNTGDLTVEGDSTLGNSLEDTTTISGDASVGRDLTVAGATTTNGIDNSGQTITNLADGTAPTDAATVGQVEAGDDALGARIDQEITDRTNADNALGGRIDQEITDRTNADNALGSRIDTERDNSIARDNALGNRIDTERDNSIARDNALGGRIDQEVADRIAGDAALSMRINDEESARIAADNALGLRIDDTNLRVTNEVNRLDGRINGVQADLANETNNRIAADNALRAGIEENTRGIAMVAAMTNTRVEAGKTHGVDFNMAQFQSETGFAFGYANRINENVQVHGSLASTTDFDESVVRVGVAVQW